MKQINIYLFLNILFLFYFGSCISNNRNISFSENELELNSMKHILDSIAFLDLDYFEAHKSYKITGAFQKQLLNDLIAGKDVKQTIDSIMKSNKEIVSFHFCNYYKEDSIKVYRTGLPFYFEGTSEGYHFERFFLYNIGKKETLVEKGTITKYNNESTIDSVYSITKPSPFDTTEIGTIRIFRKPKK